MNTETTAAGFFRLAAIHFAEAAKGGRASAYYLKLAQLVRDARGWHEVVRVSAKSVTVETGYSWTDRIALDKVLEVRR